MKRILIYIIAAALLGSCAQLLDNPPRIPGDHTEITLTPVCLQPGTKADPTAPGDPTFNENTISNYFWFIYGDEEGIDLRKCGYKSDNTSTSINLDDVLPTDVTQWTGYTYVVANLPSDKFTYKAAEGESKGGILYNGTVYSNLSEIRSLPVDLSFYQVTSPTTGTVAPGNFVMRTSAPVPFTLTPKKNVNVTDTLSRLAIKIVFDLKVAEEINQTETNPAGAEVYKKTWISDVDHIQVYMLWGSTHATVAGTPIEYGSEGVSSDWFYSASPRYAMYGYDVQNNKYAESGYNYELGSTDGNVVGAKGNQQTLQIPTSVWRVAYKVKEDTDGEPIWIWNYSTAEADKTDANIGNLSYGDWDYDLDANGQKQELRDADGNVMRYLATENVSRKYWMFSSTPLYTTPITWDVNSAHAPFIKIILPWQGCKRADNGAGAITEYDTKNTEFYYKILVPNRTTLEANNFYRISLDLSVLGSEADDVPVLVNGEYHVVNWNTPEQMGGEFQAGRYLNCETAFAFYSQNEMPISVSSSHDIEVVSSSATYQNYSGTTVTTATLPTNTYFITATGNSLVTINHTMETDLDEMENYDVSPITYTFTIQHKGEGGSAYQKTITVVQYPSLYISSEDSYNVFVNNVTNTSNSTDSSFKVYVTGRSDNNPLTYENDRHYNRYLGSVSSRNTALSSSTNNNPTMYTVHVGVLNSDTGVIGDPRTAVAFTYPPQYTSGGSPVSLSDYMGTGADADNFVAPVFKMATSLGKTYAVSYEGAQKRCASYQENGYPAGRWRLPTKAEIEFVASLSKYNLIPSMFETTTSTSLYWASGNQGFQGSSREFISMDEASISTSQQAVLYTIGGVTYSLFCRCVYDEWYWGDDTLSSKTTWGGYQTDYMNN